MSRRLRVLDEGAQDPRANMALDAGLLHSGPPTLRLYGWQPAGLSLGRFQEPGDFADVQAPHVLVRRITGGGAIWHEQEITFALALPADWLPDSIDESYVLIHDAVLRALRAVDVPAHRLTCAGRPCGARPAQRWCFAIPGTHDLVTPDGRKLVGSAQRRVRRPEPRVLHHGSLVLRASAVTPFCAAVADHVDPLQAEPELRRLLAAELAAALRAEPVPAAAAAGA